MLSPLWENGKNSLSSKIYNGEFVWVECEESLFSLEFFRLYFKYRGIRKMKIPKGYTEDRVLSDIEYVATKLSRHFKFGYYTQDDIKQEGCVFALGGLKKYNPKKETSLRTFLYTHVRNRFINLRRNQCFTQSNPCLSCGFYDADNLGCTDKCREFENKTYCQEYTKWLAVSKSKSILMCDGFSQSDNNLDVVVNSDALEHMCNQEILNTINANMSSAMREDYCRFLQGARLSNNRKQKLISFIKKILKEKGLMENDGQND